ncbi:uncharacterized protein LOC108739059 isoform X2 [Agrilus planipennis]|uniref:Uncharacterized protein LOC108739059 isoform X2 n=1 Tax=Agrilus planipennis TaxID=224129 RepID=A0A1W4WWK1_AGRPL|nr:uncharacterized protein LOC108739059 isoform X2 [Agrilus planipennis]
MDSDEDLFYDSLDEEFFSTTVTCDPDDSAPSEKSVVEDKTLEADSVPLYDGEIPRNDLSTKDTKNKCKKCLLRSPLIRESTRSDYFVLEKDSFTSRNKNSYLSLFKSRTTPKSNRIPGQETDRATDGDVTDRFSFCSGLTDDTENCCEFKDCVNDQTYDDCIYCQSARTNEVSQISLDTVVSEMSELKSVSQQHLTEFTKGGRTTGRKLHGKPKAQIVSPILDKKKLELLQRKQNYGLKVSQKNRIKFKERQVLQNLKKEIDICRENRKKELDDKKELQTPSNTLPMPSSSSIVL